MTRRALTDHDEARIAERYQQGETLRQLARDYGCSVQPIRLALKKHRVQPRRYLSFIFGRGRYA